MKHKYSKALFIFRRDLRLFDNIALLEALKLSDIVIPIFIFDPIQVSEDNQYKSNNAIQFMIESLRDLDKQLKLKHGKLYKFFGKTNNIIENLFKHENIDAVFINRDYTPFSIKRDEAIYHLCNKYNIQYNSFSDLLLTEPEEILTNAGIPYSVFSAFYKKALKKVILATNKNNYLNFYNKTLSPLLQSQNDKIYKKILSKNNDLIWVKGGRTNGLKLLRNLKKFDNYSRQKDYPIASTTNLSAHIKFGTVSIREVYHAIVKQLGQDHSLIRQLFWRDFFTHIAYDSPFIFGHAYKKKYDDLVWNYNENFFKAWREGKTGFPIIDAGMRQLNRTGFIHNRVRMLVASFLIKDLHIDWRLGEKYFAQKLVDYDPAVNNGNWQWVASTGCDSQQYFRIFNPWLQQKKFDPECKYIKKWVPELKNVETKIIHSLFKTNVLIDNYSKPIIDHAREVKLAIKMFK